MPFVDALRGLAAVSVVFTHTGGIFAAGDLSPGSMLAWLSDNRDYFAHGVALFFVISGFVIAHSIGDQPVDKKYIGNFALRRSLRLDPPYWALIFLALGLLLARTCFGNEPPQLPSWRRIVTNLFYVHKILGYEHIVGITWTLCLEVQFYLLFIMALALVDTVRSRFKKCRREWVIAALFVLSLVSPAGLISTPDTPFHEVWFTTDCHKFLLGAVLWYSWTGRLPRWIMGGVLGLLALAIFIGRAQFFPISSFVFDSFIAGVLAGAIFVVAATADGFYRWLDWWPLQWLGRISYSLYLIHMLVIDAMMGVQKRVGLHSAASVVAFQIIVFAASMSLAWMMYVVIEKPSMRFAARFKSPRDDQAGGIEGPASPTSVEPFTARRGQVMSTGAAS